MVRRSSSYNFIKKDIYINELKTNKKYKSCDDLLKIYNCFDIKKDFVMNKSSVSYGDFLLKNPKATKKERIQAIKRFYDKLC